MTRGPSGGGRSRTGGPVLVALACAALLALVAVAVAVAAKADVVARGDLLPWAGDDVRRVDALGLRFYLSSEFDPQPDAVTTWVLVAAGSVAAFAASLLWSGGSARVVTFFVLSAAGAYFLALDEGFAVHESIGHNLGFLADLPGVKRPDDVVFGLYALAALVFAIAYRRLLASSRAALALFAGALAMAATVSLLDFTDLAAGGVEEAFEILTAAVVLAAYVTLARGLVLRALLAPA